ncbi:MAG: carboxypeptidase-like regulatory domain-containing protein [Prevotella sp.]|jgi:hypothetical protein
MSGYKHLLSLVLALMALTGAYAQELTSIAGTVYDKSNGKKLAAVTVTTENGSATTVTNEEGDFLIKVPADTRKLVFSSLGYKKMPLPITSKKKMKVRLIPDAIALSEIVVESPENILWTAIRKIPTNYPRQNEQLRTFYRETTQKGRRFIYVAEAIENVYKTPYAKGVEKDKAEIVKGRRLVGTRKTDTLGAKMQGGPTIPVFMDVAKNRDFILSEEEMPLYKYALEMPQEIAGRTQIVISFRPAAIIDRPLFYGKYFIDRQTLAFTRAELQLDMSDKKKATNFLLVSKPTGVRFKPYEYNIVVNYQQTDTVMRMNYLRTTMRFKCDWKRRLFSSPYTVDAEMVVTANSPAMGNFRKSVHGFSQHDSYYDHVEYFLDPAFWENYNIIAPTERLNKAVDKLLKKHKK